MNNYSSEPQQQSPYGPYQPVPNYQYPPPTTYQPVDTYAPPPYQPMNPYAPQPPYGYPPPPPPMKPRGQGNRMLFFVIGGIVVLLVLVSSIGIFALRGGTSVAATPTPTLPQVPSVAAAYGGSVHNSTVNLDANMAMVSIVQNREKMNGAIRFGLPLIGSGSFTGTVSPSGAVQFTVTSTDNGSLSLAFNGTIDTSGFMSGDYTVTTNGQKGTWKAQPTPNPIVYPVLYHAYSGSYDNTATGKSGSLSLQVVTQNAPNFNGTLDTSPVNGTVGSDNSIHFTAIYQGVTLDFVGTVNIDGSLSGSYTASAGGKGTWKLSS